MNATHALASISPLALGPILRHIAFSHTLRGLLGSPSSSSSSDSSSPFSSRVEILRLSVEAFDPQNEYLSASDARSERSRPEGIPVVAILLSPPSCQ
ncbi:MAG: hypothetical protein Q8P67_13985 [archaeon]|nr:hypothetical protein [archaeon]